MDRDLMISGSDDGLQILRTEHRTDAGTSCRTLAADDAGIKHHILARGTDGDHTAFGAASSGFIHVLLQLFLCRPHTEAFQVLCGVQGKLIVVNLQPAEFRTLSFQNQRIITGFLQIVSEVSSTVGGRGQARLRGQCGNIEAVGAGGPGPCQRTGGDDDDIFRSKRILRSVEGIKHDLGSHGLAADVKLPLPVGPGVFLHFSGGQIHHHDLSHIPGILRHMFSSPFSLYPKN